jgi:hypothetical protein
MATTRNLDADELANSGLRATAGARYSAVDGAFVVPVNWSGEGLSSGVD